MNKFNYYDFVQDGLFIVNNNFEIIFWNKTIEEFSNIKRDNVLNKNILEEFPRLNKPIYVETLQKHI